MADVESMEGKVWSEAAFIASLQMHDESVGRIQRVQSSPCIRRRQMYSM